MFNFSGQRPTNLGSQNSQLLPCPGTPNCVCSQDSNQDFVIEPLSTVNLQQLRQIIEQMERTNIVEQTDGYLWVEFTSKLMGFVDDLEFLVDSASQVTHVRSASRLGKSDLGVNRQRVELIRQQLTAS
ncbi:MAG: DUF1499 domain-containing protein [Cyanobacteria bacterium P01_H01_bin.15]